MKGTKRDLNWNIKSKLEYNKEMFGISIVLSNPILNMSKRRLMKYPHICMYIVHTVVAHLPGISKEVSTGRAENDYDSRKVRVPHASNNE